MNNQEYEKTIKEIHNKKGYKLKEGILYKVDDNNEKRIIRDYEFEGLMYMIHDHELSAHMGIEATYNRIKEKYCWKGMRKDIETYVRSCDRCQRRGKPQGKHELHSI